MPAKDVMPKFYRGQLHSGSKRGPKVKSLQQALAIASSEHRAEKAHGGKYPEKKRGRRSSSKTMAESLRSFKMKG